MSGEMIAIVAVGVALAGVILTSLRGTEARLGNAQIKDLRGEVGEAARTHWRMRSASCASAWRSWKDCWKDCARPSPGGSRPARGSLQPPRVKRVGERVP